MAMSCFPGLGSGTVTYRQHLSLRTNWGWGFSSLLVSLPVPIPSWQLLPFRTRDWTQDSLSLPRHGQLEFLHDCSSVLELFYQMGSVFIRKERRKGRRNEERKGRRRGGERITVFTVLSDVLRVGYGGRLHSYLELEPRQGLGFLSAFPRIFLLHSCVIIFLWKIKELYYKVCRKAAWETIRILCIQSCHSRVSACLYKSGQHVFETLRHTEQF